MRKKYKFQSLESPSSMRKGMHTTLIYLTLSLQEFALTLLQHSGSSVLVDATCHSVRQLWQPVWPAEALTQ